MGRFDPIPYIREFSIDKLEVFILKLRLNRLQYTIFFLLSAISWLVLSALVQRYISVSSAGFLGLLILIFLNILPLICRLHDGDLNGWWSILPSILLIKFYVKFLMVYNFQNFISYSLSVPTDSVWVGLYRLVDLLSGAMFKSGMLILLIMQLFLLFTPGTNGKNSYGLPQKTGDICTVLFAVFLITFVLLFSFFFLVVIGH